MVGLMNGTYDTAGFVTARGPLHFKEPQRGDNEGVTQLIWPRKVGNRDCFAWDKGLLLRGSFLGVASAHSTVITFVVSFVGCAAILPQNRSESGKRRGWAPKGNATLTQVPQLNHLPGCPVPFSHWDWVPGPIAWLSRGCDAVGF